MTVEQKPLVWVTSSRDDAMLWHRVRFSMAPGERFTETYRALCGELLHSEDWIFQREIEPGPLRCGRCFHSLLSELHTVELSAKDKGRLTLEDLWEVINGYARSVGGDPDKLDFDNITRMQAVAELAKLLECLLDERMSPTGSTLPAESAASSLSRSPTDPDASLSGLPTNPDCTGSPCGEKAHYCSNRCWTIGRLRAAHDQVAEYERQLAVYTARESAVRK